MDLPRLPHYTFRVFKMVRDPFYPVQQGSAHPLDDIPKCILKQDNLS